MRNNDSYDVHGGVSALAATRFRDDETNQESLSPIWAWFGLPRPSPVCIAFWMTVSACMVILGVAAARDLSFQNSLYNVHTVLAALLQPAGGDTAEFDTSRHASSKLKSRSSFATEEAFLKSQSFQTARFAGTILPLALYCKDRKAVGIVKSVLGTVTGKDPYHAELMAIGWLARHRKRLGYRPTDCGQRLPAAMAELRGRI
jgi:hypothetical protein